MTMKPWRVIAGLSAFALLADNARAQVDESPAGLRMWREPLAHSTHIQADLGLLRSLASASSTRPAYKPALPPDDRWFGADKGRHFLVSAGIHMAMYSGLRIVGVGRAVALSGATVTAAAAGVAKEVLDARAGSEVSRRDLVWDGLGLLAGSGLLVAVDGRP